MTLTVRQFLACEKAATAVEYGLIAALLAGVIIGASGSIQSALKATFTSTADGVAAATK